jgi:hypothetical protein
MERFNELLEKRKNLIANIFEEEELIELSKKLNPEQLQQVDKSLLTYSNGQRLDKLLELLDRINSTLSA